jgi:hypothetical protein
MIIPPELEVQLFEVLRTARDNANEIYQEAAQKYKGYKQHRIDALANELEDVDALLLDLMRLKAQGEQK